MNFIKMHLARSHKYCKSYCCTNTSMLWINLKLQEVACKSRRYSFIYDDILVQVLKLIKFDISWVLRSLPLSNTRSNYQVIATCSNINSIRPSREDLKPSMKDCNYIVCTHLFLRCVFLS